MKKFRVGDKIELKHGDPGRVYVVTHRDGNEWRGKVAPEHVSYGIHGYETTGAFLGNEPKRWRVIEKAKSAKDLEIEELRKANRDISQGLRDLENLREEAELNRDLNLLAAGYVSIKRLRRNTLAGLNKSYDGVSPFARVDITMRHPGGETSDAKYLTEYFKALTRQN